MDDFRTAASAHDWLFPLVFLQHRVTRRPIPELKWLELWDTSKNRIENWLILVWCNSVCQCSQRHFSPGRDFFSAASQISSVGIACAGPLAWLGCQRITETEPFLYLSRNFSVVRDDRTGSRIFAALGFRNSEIGYKIFAAFGSRNKEIFRTESIKGRTAQGTSVKPFSVSPFLPRLRQ